MKDPSNDPVAQREIYTEASRLALEYALDHVAEEVAVELAHDLASKVLRLCMADPNKFEGDGPTMDGYIYVSVMNRLKNQRRDERRRTIAEEVHGVELEAGEPEWRRPDKRMEGQECEEMERQAVESLAPKTRTVYLVKRQQPKATYKEIAAQTGIAPGTVHWHLSEANATVEGAAQHYIETGGFKRMRPGRHKGGTRE